jgi:DNA-binding CsgD family transcriptional regulator
LTTVAQKSPGTAGGGWAELWLEFEPTARLVVDWGLQVVWRNAAADALLSSGGLLNVRDGVLGCSERAAAAQIQSVLWNAKADRPTSTVVGQPDDHGLLITGILLKGADGACVGLQVREIDVELRYELADLEPVFGLTRSEQETVGLLLAGLSSAEIARNLDKSILTVRTHIKRAYAKLGISSREQLFAKLLRYGTVW